MTHDLRSILPDRLRSALPDVLGIWLFGSHAQGTAGADSDVDVAVLLPGRADPLSLWTQAQALAQELGCDVDLVDLRAASTVLQYQIVTAGELLWQKDAQAALYESYILSEKTALDEARAGLLADIHRDGRVFR
jgi:predicted nucleotidyltransferase